METFLNQVAKHYAKELESKSSPLAGTVFVLPNKRSALHLKTAMKAAVETVMPGKKLRLGAYVSINDFFQKVYGIETSDRIPLLLKLYECYRSLNDQAEPLDDFIHWGRVMIADFDNVDKYLVDADKLFVNVDDFRSIQDTYQYLTETQKEAIERFLAHFRDQSGRVTVNMDGGEEGGVKKRFLKVWNILGELYKKFNETLEAEGLAYEGRIYRQLAMAIKDGIDVPELMKAHYPYHNRFVFVGLNALNECEKTVLRALRDAGMAEFEWDFSSREIKDGRNKASLFLRKNIEEFPQVFPLDVEQPLRRPDVRVVSVPSSVGQTKLAPQILEAVTGKPEETAFVLPDETLLMPLLFAIPETYEKVNITMGYPMNKSAVYAFIKAFVSVHLTTRIKDGHVFYHNRAVSNLFSSSMFRSLMKTPDKAIVEAVKREAKQYVPLTDIVKEEGDGGCLREFFDPMLMDTAMASAEQNKLMCGRLMKVLMYIIDELGFMANGTDENDESNADTSSNMVDAGMELEFANRYLEDLKHLLVYELNVKPATWLRLLDGMVMSESVPFEGDALEGLQVMGTLETRALDFKNVVILSCNEDLFPHRSADNSFIPPELRKGFGMPTLEYQDAVWAYYFYRLIQRAENVWLIYDSRTEGLLSGEESRYIKQLEYHFGYRLDKYTAVAPLNPVAEEETIEKTEEDIALLRGERHISASSLQSYLGCPVKFYYQAVKGLKSEDEAPESLDAAMLGTVFHGCMESLYKGRTQITADDLGQMYRDEEALRALVKEWICKEMKSLDVEGRNLVVEEVVLEYIKATLMHDLQILRENGSRGFRIIGLERYVKTTIDGFEFIGFVDRIDSYKNGEVRIVDYKTGHVEDDDILITDKNAQTVVDKLFGESNTGRPKIALQLYLYGKFARNGILREGEKVVNSIYSTAKLLTNPLPDVEENETFVNLVDEKVHTTLAEIADTSIPWKRTCDKKLCAMCDFRSICGR